MCIFKTGGYWRKSQMAPDISDFAVLENKSKICMFFDLVPTT